NHIHKKEYHSAAMPTCGSTRQRFDEVAESLALIGFFADVAEHGEEIVGPHVARQPRYLALEGLLPLERAGPLRKKLQGRRETHAIFCGHSLFRQFDPVEIGHLARADDVELQHLEIRLDVVGYVAAREIDEMRLLAIGAAFELPHDDEALALFVRGFEIVGEFEEAFQEPGLLVQPVVGQHRLAARDLHPLRAKHRQGSRADQQVSPCRHDAGLVNHAGERPSPPCPAPLIFLSVCIFASKSGEDRCCPVLPAPHASPSLCWRARPWPAIWPTSMPQWNRRNPITGWRSAICAPAMSIWPRSQSTAYARPGVRWRSASPASGRMPSTASRATARSGPA